MKKVVIVFLVVIVAALLSCSKEKAVNEEPLSLNFSNPYPVDGADSIPLYTTFSWGHDNPDSIVYYYDMYLGTNFDPPLIKPDIYENSYLPFTLHDSTTYYWKIVARDRDQNEYIGPIWSFSALNGPPTQPANPFPSEDTTVPPSTVELRWECYELDDEPIEFDIYFGAETDPPLLISNYSSLVLNIDDLGNQIDYYWKIVARDTLGKETAGDVWHFISANYAPSVPSSPYPEDSAAGISIDFSFAWQSEDTEGDMISYDFYLGIADDPPLEMVELTANSLISAWQRSAVAQQTLLDIYAAQTEFWDEHGIYTCNGLTASSNSPNTYYIQLGIIIDSLDVYTYLMSAGGGLFTCIATANLDSDATNDTWTIDQDSTLTNTVVDMNTPFNTNTAYYWKIVAKDTYGDSTISPVWHFTTVSE